MLDAVVPAGVRGGAGTRDGHAAVGRYEPKPAQAGTAPSLKAVRRSSWTCCKIAGRGQASRMDARRAGPRRATARQAPITALRRKGLIRSHTGRIATLAAAGGPAAREKHLVLNPDQQQALRAILDAMNARRHQTILIHGVTGSGKTEVYIQAIQEVIHFGRQAIVLVPEISLTPQTVERFRQRFGAVAVLHSHLSDAERHWHWQRIAEGAVSVVVGARSAIFAPTPNLGLIVLDEEHESSFKQESVPRYHARDVAIARAAAEGIPLVLGSATPSLESWHRAQTGQYALVEMPRRVLDRPMPAVGTIDLRGQQRERRALARGHQPADARRHEGRAGRGRAGDSAAEPARLLHAHPVPGLRPRGAVSRVRHRPDAPPHRSRSPCATIATTKCRRRRRARRAASPASATRAWARSGSRPRSAPDSPTCWRCGWTPTRCRPTAATSGRLSAFRSGKVRILLGTQMIAKGLDFPNVTLVGVINADTALHLPDFRAAERTFHLVTQVAGRTGRGPKGGRVLVQTFSPDHPAIQAAVRHDYAAFAAGELPMRADAPLSAVCQHDPAGGPRPGRAGRGGVCQLYRRAARVRRCTQRQTDARVLGPAPCPFARLKGRYRFQIQVQGPDGEPLRAAVAPGHRRPGAAGRRAVDRGRGPGGYVVKGREARGWGMTELARIGQ